MQNSGTRLPQLMNTSCFHQNVGEGNKAMSPDPFSAKRLVKGLAERDYSRYVAFGFCQMLIYLQCFGPLFQFCTNAFVFSSRMGIVGYVKLKVNHS